MVSTCANPACKEKFTYFGTGELLVKTSAATGRQELFWLCQHCAIEWQAPADLIPLPLARLRARGRPAAA